MQTEVAILGYWGFYRKKKIAFKSLLAFLTISRKKQMKIGWENTGKERLRVIEGWKKKNPRLLILRCGGISDAHCNHVWTSAAYIPTTCRVLSFMHNALSFHISFQPLLLSSNTSPSLLSHRYLPLFSLPPMLLSFQAAGLCVSLGWGPAGLNDSLHPEG